MKTQGASHKYGKSAPSEWSGHDPIRTDTFSPDFRGDPLLDRLKRQHGDPRYDLAPETQRPRKIA